MVKVFLPNRVLLMAVATTDGWSWSASLKRWHLDKRFENGKKDSQVDIWNKSGHGRRNSSENILTWEHKLPFEGMRKSSIWKLAKGQAAKSEK